MTLTLDIPYRKMNADDLNARCEVMRKGNTLLRKCAEMCGMEYRKFRIRLFKSNFDLKSFCEAHRNEGCKPDLKQEQIVEIVKALPHIQAVRNIEWDMVCGFSRLVKQQASKWAKGTTGIISYEDFEQEGFMALIDSIYNYAQTDAEFITFAQWSIARRMTTTSNRNNPLCPWSNQAIKLMGRYNKACKVQAVIGPINQESIISALGVDDEEAQIIRDCLIRVALPSQEPPLGGGRAERDGDYSAKSRSNRDRTEPIPGEYHFRNYDGSIPLQHELRDAIKRAGLSDLELKVLETFISPHYGWQEELASQSINPKTGKRYTRQAISLFLQSAVKKVKSVYLSKVA